MSAPACMAAGVAWAGPSQWGATPWVMGLLSGVSLAAVVVLAAAGCWLAWRGTRRERLARRADRNGRALLELADEIDLALWSHRFDGGDAALPRRHWSRLCRRLAMEHLECINCLMFDGARGRGGTARERIQRS